MVVFKKIGRKGGRVPLLILITTVRLDICGLSAYIQPDASVRRREINMNRLVLLLAASVVAASYAHAADNIALVAPDHCKVLKEDASVRVIHCILKKGDKVGTHSHPPFVVYFIKGGISRYTLADGTTRDVETKSDGAYILPPVTHSGEQLSDVDEILVELKQ